MWPFRRKQKKTQSRPAPKEEIDHALIKRLMAQQEANQKRITKHIDLSNRLSRTYKASDKSTWEPAAKICQQLVDYAPTWFDAFNEKTDLMNRLSRAYGDDGDLQPTKIGELSHTGFKQLAIIREKQGRFDDAITASRGAKKMGWRGDWDVRIAKLEKKKAKQT